MDKTPFPTRPADVAPLTFHEFSVDLDISEPPSLDAVCGRFVEDVNRALVRLVRFRALKTLSDRADMTDWLATGVHTSQDVCAVAATFALNENWGFDKDAFCSAVSAAAFRRTRIARQRVDTADRRAAERDEL